MSDEAPNNPGQPIPGLRRGRGRPRGYAKTGGRKKGVKNKRNQAVAEMLAEMGCYPAQGLARIAQNPKFPVEIRAKCYADLMRYVHPQLSAVDQHVTGN